MELIDKTQDEENNTRGGTNEKGTRERINNGAKG